MTISSGSIDASTTIRSGDTKKLVRRRRLQLNFCYCSLNNRCWNIAAAPGPELPEIPQPVSDCEAGSAIRPANP